MANLRTTLGLPLQFFKLSFSSSRRKLATDRVLFFAKKKNQDYILRGETFKKTTETYFSFISQRVHCKCKFVFITFQKTPVLALNRVARVH